MASLRHRVDNPSLEQQRPARVGAHLRVLRSLIIGGLTVAFALAGGFAIFLSSIHDHANPSQVSKADAIVVLTGGHARLVPAALLLREGYGERLLVSGVNATISDRALIDALNIDPSLYQCCVDIDRVALDTIGNAREIVSWAQGHSYRSIIVVTNDYHMPRSLIELRRAAPEISFSPFVISNQNTQDNSIAEIIDRYRVLTGEYVKLIVSRLRHSLPAPG